MKKYVIPIILASLLLTACPEIEQVSPIPEVHFKSLTFGEAYDSLDNLRKFGIMEFSFIDGDADLGVYKEVHSNLNLPDSARNGIFINFYEKLDGIYIQRFLTQQVIEKDTSYIDTVDFNLWFPYDEKLDRVGQNKIVKGNIRSRIPFTNSLPYDTMRFEFYIRDRALHKSNYDVTTDFTNSDITF